MITLPDEKHWWRRQAVCRSNPTFDTYLVEEQKEMCSHCPVIQECLNFALEHELPTSTSAVSWPVYGGLDGEERQVILKERRRLELERAKKLDAEAA